MFDSVIFPAESVLPAPVLVVEDEPLLQARLRTLLLGLGYAADALVFAATLAQARACLAEQPMALALVDLALPDGSGIALIEQMRAEDPGLGILVISAWSSEEAILGALRAGATGYVLKERDDIEISLSIRSVLRGGAPIDPFIARRILELLGAPQAPTAAAAAAEQEAMTSVAGGGVETASASAFASLTPLASSVPSTGAPSLAAPPAQGAALKLSEALSERETQILRLVADGLSNREIADQICLSRYTVESHVKRIYRKLAVSSRTMAVRTARTRGVIE